MESLPASLMVDIFMNSLEKDIFNSDERLVKNVEYWFRYVDDVLRLRKSTVVELRDLLMFIIFSYPTHQFTLEIRAPKIHFLDLSVIIEQVLHKFDNYREPTYTDIVIDRSFS